DDASERRGTGRGNDAGKDVARAALIGRRASFARGGRPSSPTVATRLPSSLNATPTRIPPRPRVAIAVRLWRIQFSSSTPGGDLGGSSVASYSSESRPASARASGRAARLSASLDAPRSSG